MARALALIVRRPLPAAAGMLRPLLVLGSALALVLAGPALPALGL
jgi:hypothetical protein